MMADSISMFESKVLLILTIYILIIIINAKATFLYVFTPQ